MPFLGLEQSTEIWLMLNKQEECLTGWSDIRSVRFYGVRFEEGLSAGRVQSVATRMICDREKEIQAFKPEEYWTLKGNFFPILSNKQSDSDKEVQIFEASLYGLKDKKLVPKARKKLIRF